MGPIERAGQAAQWASRLAEQLKRVTPAGTEAGWLRHVPESVRELVGARLPGAAARAPEVAEGGRFLTRSFSNAAGSRPYKLYVPSGYHGQSVALVVMLHGCTQSPDDFAAGTAMNRAAERQTFLVAYPGQVAGAHAQKCWNWFSAEHQRRGAGEPSLIAGITREVMEGYAVDPRRVFVAGLSAGGAAAAVMAETYPELYAAVGVHSGLAFGAASDLPSALAAMRRGGREAPRPAGGRAVPVIVFHGDQDTTVSPRNAEQVIRRAMGDAAGSTRVESGSGQGGRGYSRTSYAGADGRAQAELWMVQGAGHAWSGGSSAGSYTDPRGPDATGEMLRFFWEHPRPD